MRGPGTYEARGHVLCWDGRSDGGLGLASGVYLIRLVFDGHIVPDEQSRLAVVQ